MLHQTPAVRSYNPVHDRRLSVSIGRSMQHSQAKRVWPSISSLLLAVSHELLVVAAYCVI
jgi:hypothetical protein